MQSLPPILIGWRPFVRIYGIVMYKFLVGIIIGLVIGGLFFAFFSQYAESNLDIVFNFGLALTFCICVLIGFAALFVPKIARKYFSGIKGTAESIVDKVFIAARKAAEGKPLEAIDGGKAAGVEIAAWYAASAFRTFIVGASIATLVAFGSFLGVTILVRQNQLLKGQNELQTKQTELLNQQTKFAEKQTELQTLQTNAARLEQFNAISKEIGEIKPYNDAIRDIILAMNDARSARINLTLLIDGYAKSFKKIEGSTVASLAIYARQISRLTVDNFRISPCANKSRSLPMVANPCVNDPLMSAIMKVKQKEKEAFPPHALTLLGIYGDGRMDMASIVAPLTDPKDGRGVVYFSKSIKQCRSAWESSTVEFTISKLASINLRSAAIVEAVRTESEDFVLPSIIRGLVKDIYDLGVRHGVVSRRHLIDQFDEFQEIDLQKTELIIGLSFVYVSDFFVGLEIHCSKTLKLFKEMASEMDPIINKERQADENKNAETNK